MNFKLNKGTQNSPSENNGLFPNSGGDPNVPTGDDVEISSSSNTGTGGMTQQEQNNIKDFLDMFSNDSEEEVIMSDEAINNIEGDIILSQTKKKTPIAPIILGVVFVVLLAITVSVAYILANYNIIFKHSVANADYYNDIIVPFSLIDKSKSVQSQELQPDQTILYTDDDPESTFASYKMFKIREVRRTTVYGYDFSKQDFREIHIEKVRYILNGNATIPGENNQTNADQQAQPQ